MRRVYDKLDILLLNRVLVRGTDLLIANYFNKTL